MPNPWPSNDRNDIVCSNLGHGWGTEEHDEGQTSNSELVRAAAPSSFDIRYSTFCIPPPPPLPGLGFIVFVRLSPGKERGTRDPFTTACFRCAEDMAPARAILLDRCVRAHDQIAGLESFKHRSTNSSMTAVPAHMTLSAAPQ